RFGDSTAAPALDCILRITLPLMPLASSGRSGAFVSATSTSPLGSVYTQRGCVRPVAKAFTSTPCGAVGLPPSGQPFASATCTTGMVCLSGLASAGFGPTVLGGDCAGARSVGPTLQATSSTAVT